MTNSEKIQVTNEPISLSRRQRGLVERRQRLVKAAGELIEESEDGSFSMPKLAEKAGLSLATPYNLFGSKAAVLNALFESQVQSFYQDNSWMNGLCPADLVLGVIDRLIDAYSRKPIFYKNLRRAWYSLGTAEHMKYVKPESSHLVQPLMNVLEREGHIPREIPVAALELTIMRIFNSAFEEWTYQNWTMGRLKSELYSSFALLFRGVFDMSETQKIEIAVKDLLGA